MPCLLVLTVALVSSLWLSLLLQVVAQNDGARYVVPAVRGFSRSIALGGEGVALQDILRLLTLWFQYGEGAEVHAAVREGVDAIAVDTWLAVIPQVIARIHSPTPLVRRSVHALLDRVAEEHPQGLIYPLTVASKSDSEARRGAALAVLGKIRTRCDTLVEQAASTYRGLRYTCSLLSMLTMALLTIHYCPAH